MKNFIGFVLVAAIMTLPFWFNQQDTITVKQQAELMQQDWQEVVIKQDGNVLYSGSVDNLDNDILSKEVIEIANCEDSFAITLFVE